MGLETGERCRCHSLPITPPASLRSHGSRPRPTRHIPPSPLAGRGVPTRLRSTPPLPPLPGGARQGGRGVPGGKDRRGERKGDGRMRSDRDERGERGKKKSRPGSRTHCRSVLNQLSGSLAVPCDGTGPLWWTARCSSASWRPAVAPPVEGSRQRVPRSLLLPKHGGWQQASASRRTGATPPLPLGRQPPLLDRGARQRVFRPTCSSFAPAPPLRAATGGLRYFLLPSAARALWQRVPPSSRVSGTNVTQLVDTGRRRREPANIQHFNNKINKLKWKAAAPHGRLPHTKHKLKFQAWSSLVFHCCYSSFNLSEAPPWDSRPVSGAGVIHYQLLHRPRSVPTALGPTPLAT